MKKQYIKPQLIVSEMVEMQSLLVVSTLQKAREEDYDEENVEQFRDATGRIWAD